MAVKATSEDEAPTPGPDTFDFDDYIAGKSTFPRFSHTVYLDQAAGMELAEVAEEYEKLAKRGRAIIAQQNKMSETPSHSFVDEEAERLADELESIEEKTSSMERTISELEEKVKASGIVLTFQVSTAQKLGKIHRQAEKEYQKLHGKGRDTDVEYVTGKAEHVLLSQLDAFCVEITLHDGTKQKPPGREGFSKLLSSLVPSESMRLMMALSKALDASSDWAKRVDAGFPSGSVDVEEESVDRAGSEGSSIVGSSPLDHVAWEEEHMGQRT